MGIESYILASFIASLQQKHVLPFLLDIPVLFWEFDFATNSGTSFFSSEDFSPPGIDLDEIAEVQISSEASFYLNSGESRIEAPSLPASSPDAQLGSFVKDDPLLCLICELPATISCPDCEENFCCRHMYQCHQCQTTFCGDCFDIHADDGHWSDSAAAAAIFDSAHSRLSRNQFTYRPLTYSDSIASFHGAIAETDAQISASHKLKACLHSALRRLLARMLPLGVGGMSVTEVSQ